MAIEASKIIFTGTLALSVGGAIAGSLFIPSSSKEERLTSKETNLSSIRETQEIKEEESPLTRESLSKNSVTKICKIYEALSQGTKSNPKVDRLKYKGEKDEFLNTVDREWDSKFKTEVEDQCKKLISSGGATNIYVWETIKERGSVERKWIYSGWLQNNDWIASAELVQDS